MRIVSLLPAATEIVCALGLRASLVGISHECDFPEDLDGLPVLTSSTLPGGSVSPGEIDAAVSSTLRSGESIYRVDEELLAQLEPDLVLTQALCDVCAVSYDAAHRAAGRLERDPRVVSLEPRDLEGVFDSIIYVGSLTGTDERAAGLVGKLKDDLAWLKAHQPYPPVRLVYLEWLDPFYSAGHWVPELIDFAGGKELLGEAGAKSRRIFWQELTAAQPEMILLGPCGFDDDAARAQYEASGLLDNPKWQALPAVQQRRVYTVDANSYFSRPGPRLAEGTAMLHDWIIVEQDFLDRS